MADISDNSGFSLGMANLYSPTALANRDLIQANTGLAQQQTQAAAIGNANARIQYQLFRQAMQHVSDFSGQDGPTLGSGVNDSSGVTASNASPATSGLPRAGAGASGVSADDSDEAGAGQSAADEAHLQANLESKYNVDPAGTSAEQHAIMQAHQYAVQMKLSGNKGLADAAEQRVAMLKELRDMNVTDRKNSAQLDANEHYDKLSAVESAPNAQAFEIMENVMPETARALQRAHPDATPEELDEIARDTTGHMGAFIHRFTNRPVKVGDDGATYDEATGMRVDVPIRGVSPEKQAALLEQANKIVTTKNSDGTETTEPQYKKDGYKNPNLWVTDAVAQIRSRNDARNLTEFVGNHYESHGHFAPGQPPGPGGALYRGPQPGAAPQPGAPPQPGAQPAAAAPGALPPPDLQRQLQQRTDSGLLPNVDPNALPKIQLPQVRPGVSQSPADAETAKGVATSRLEQMKGANDAYLQDQKEGALLKAAQRESAALSADPRMAGPGSEVARWLAKARTAVTGQPPDSLVDLGGLDKILLQLGAQNVRAALSGQKITQAEFLMMLGKGNPNTDQPLATVNKLLGYLGAQNEYDQRFNRTKLAALNKGANPLTIDSDIGAQSDRGDFVEHRVGMRPPIASAPSGGGGGSSGGAPVKVQSRADAMKLSPGTVFVTPDGRQLVR